MAITELIEALQNCANVNYEYQDEGASCSKCPYKEASYCKRAMMRNAADALEAQQKALDECAKQLAYMAAKLPKEDEVDPDAQRRAQKIFDLVRRMKEGTVKPIEPDHA